MTKDFITPNPLLLIKSLAFILFTLTHVIITQSYVSKPIALSSFFFLFVGILSFFFHQYFWDLTKKNPSTRLSNLRSRIVFCIILTLICFSTHGLQSILAVIVALTYSYLMHHDFFIPEKIKNLNTIYLFTHTLSATFISLAAFTYLTSMPYLKILSTPTFLNFSLANWLLLNVFHFGRKTFSSEEERSGEESYSALFGSIGVAVLIISQALLAQFLALTLEKIHPRILLAGFGLILAVWVLMTIRYVNGKKKEAKTYRFFNALHINLYYLIIIFAYAFNGSSH